MSSWHALIAPVLCAALSGLACSFENNCSRHVPGWNANGASFAAPSDTRVDQPDGVSEPSDASTHNVTCAE